MDYKDKKVLVIGMAKSGISSAALLCKLGADVTIYDVKKREDLPAELLHELDGHSYHDMLGQDPTEIVSDMDILVLSPGVPLGLPFIRKAYELEKRVIAEIELGFAVSKADFIAITGTNGKTTTTALTGEIFKNAGIPTHVLGNIGVPITQEAMQTQPGDVVVAETAALQLDTIEAYRPRESAILNITEDHLDRYGTMENYIAAKAKIFKNQTQEDYCVLNYDNGLVRGLEDQIRAGVVWFSALTIPPNGAYVADGIIRFSLDGEEIDIMPAQELRIPGRHNLENALAATALACLYGIPADVIANTLRTFPGVEHRIEFVRTVNGVTFINDSKGTNPDATLNAIRAMAAPTVLILGGYDKKSDFVPLYQAFTPMIKAVIVLGDTAGKLIDAAEECGYQNYIRATGFEDAVLKAYSIANEGDNVLLSPACASWDMFQNFEERGRIFKEIVNGL
ncbi:UDP-N-acetylmuramoyl-L-alanine--D-glutamate ligase [Christensenella tenuis]|uniref:UDP-N-acetylmuramoylalanine--D-glutamate ligase n=1 Tax=Christensenella tenuis TaxID=2763033 RepID=A0ABR7EC27_9FIRM|nr:UDP-N-acetylmuramoyl-L-alanine--D-glutamate ligase [Christensenella tenuis]MBC5647324.1 UDP-N-acetylmuramoyl-L-alanine--D-glutamate ligase [Christensenella tenuis]